jgi:Arylsulfotransferase (ASST)
MYTATCSLLATALVITAIPLTHGLPSVIPTSLLAPRTWPLQKFKTTSYQPPEFEITKSGKPLAPGLLLFTPSSTDGSVESSAIITTDTGELVWNYRNGSFGNLFVQKLDNKPVLTLWSGTGSAQVSLQGHGYGKVHIFDTTYKEIYTVCPKINIVTLTGVNAECFADLHESFITERGSILVTAYNITTADLTSVGGPKDGWVYDGLVYEIDIKSQDVLFRWSALESGIPLTNSKLELGSTGTEESPYDFFHINSIELFGTKYLVNSRHTWSTYLIDSKGNVDWYIEVQ